MASLIKRNEMLFLRRQLGADKEEIIKAVAAVGNRFEEIEAYLLRQRKFSNSIDYMLKDNQWER